MLVLYICALSSSSHLAALITLRKYFRRYKLVAKIRIALVVLFALFLFSSMIAAIGMPETVVLGSDGAADKPPRVQRLAFLVPMFFMLLGFSTALVCIAYVPRWERVTSRSPDSQGRGESGNQRRVSFPVGVGMQLVCIVFLNPLVAFIIQITLATLSVILVLSQKFSVPDEPERWCGLQDSGENVWGFGQTLSVVMLLLLPMSARQTYLEGRQHIHEGRRVRHAAWHCMN